MLQQRQIAWPAYFVAASLSIIPPVDTVLQIVPLRLGDPRWRFGAFGLLSNAMMIPMVGLLIAFVVSSYFEHRVFQRILGVIAAAIAAAALIGLGLFALDVLQVQGDVKPTGRTAFYVAGSTASIKAILGIMTLTGFAWTAFRAPKKQKDAPLPSGAMIIGGNKKRSSVVAPVSLDVSTPTAATPAVAPQGADAE
jgi:hypothetical protein